MAFTCDMCGEQVEEATLYINDRHRAMKYVCKLCLVRWEHILIMLGWEEREDE